MWKHLLFFSFFACATAWQLVAVNQRKIVGGEPVHVEQFPFQLSLELHRGHYCGASILNPTHAITAAHCVFSGPTNQYRLRAGTSNQGSGGTLHDIEELIPHPQYGQIPYDFDVAVIRVKEPFKYSNTTQPIAIGETTPGNDELVTVSGWGALTEGGSSPNQLNAVTVPVVDTAECTREYESNDIEVTDRMFCAGKKGHDSCQGDSGGPLTIDGKLVGLVSWGVGCARPSFPGVYTRLANPEVRAWVNENAGL